jgi:hypothetical protein
MRNTCRLTQEASSLDIRFDASPETREAIEIASRVVALLDTRNSSLAVDSSEIEFDDYDGSVSVSEWLRRKSR